MTTKKKVLLIGWDGADWEHINPLLEEGLLPTLDGLINRGTMGNLATLQPVLSPMLWNSVATGKFADKHGIHGFIEPDKQNGGSRPYSSVSRKTKALWNIFSQNGIRSNVINWWASHPAEKINGVVVSNLFNGVKLDPEKGWIMAPGTVHPAEKGPDLAPLKYFPNEMTAEQILPFIPRAAEIDQEKDKRLGGFARTFAEMITTHSVATGVMETEPWEFMAIYYTGIDHFSHGFMQYHPPRMQNIKEEDFEIYKDVIRGAYRFHDMMLERLLQLAGDDTTVILCSDHGFQSGSFRPSGMPREPAGPAIWHRQYGILVMAGEGIRKDERIYGASLADIGPTILHLYGLPVGEDMDGRPLVEAFSNPGEIRSIPSWDEVAGEHGMHDGEIEMSGEQSEELLKQFVALGYIDNPGDDKEKQAASAEIESKYNLARCLVWQNRNDEAIVLLEDILFRSPWETRFIVLLADCYFRAGYYKQAARTLESGFDLKKTTVNQAVIIYARTQLALGEREKGMKFLVLASRRTPRFPSLYVQIGDVFARNRKWKQAEESYLKAIELHPEMARAHEGLSAVYVRMQKYPEAAASALDAVSLLHRLPKAHQCLGIAMLRTGEPERALLAFQTAARFSPKNPQPHRWIAVACDRLGRTKEASDNRQVSNFKAGAAQTARHTQKGRMEQLFDLPPFESEEARTERMMQERPSEHDPIKKSGKSFVLVSGLPRSGTSLMMQMLVAGGMEALTDGVRTADEDNPKGYLEWEAIRKIAEQPELLDDDAHDGKVVKTISMLLKKMPKTHDYKVIFMIRPVDEIAASQQKMLERRGTDGAELSQNDLQRGLRDHRKETLDWLESAKHMDVLKVSYKQLLKNPSEPLAEIAEFLGADRLSQPAEMQAVIDPALYRNRQAEE